MKMKFEIFKGMVLTLAVLVFVSCKEREDPNFDPVDENQITGKWQKFQVMDDDGSFSSGDPDEFWIFQADGSFVNEDGGEVTATGTYVVNGDFLTILSTSVDEPYDEENFYGIFDIENDVMTYSFTDMNYGDKSVIRFKKM